jgi:hypothetical protein
MTMQDSENRDPALTAALRALADDDARTGASPMVEARLLSEVRSIAWARRRRTYATVVAIAAALLVAVALPVWRATHRPPATPASARPLVALEERTTAFLPLFYSSVPVTNAQVVRMKVPRSALASFGLASMDSLNGSSSATVLADVLVGEDGLARAVRFVRPSAQ